MIAQIQIISMIALLGFPWSGSPQKSDTMGAYGGGAIPIEFKNGQLGIILRDDTEGNPPSKDIPMDPKAEIPSPPLPPVGGTESISISSSTQMLEVGERARVTLTKGADVGYLALSGSAEVRIDEGATVASVNMSDSATLRISSGVAVSLVNVQDNSIGVKVLVGKNTHVGHITVAGNATLVLIEEKADVAHVEVSGNTTLRISSGAVISHVTVKDTSTVHISGGTLGFLNLEGRSQAHIHGATLNGGTFSAPGVSFNGGAIIYTPETQIYLYATDVMFRAGKVSGIWDNGEHFSLSLGSAEFNEESGMPQVLAQQPKALPKQVIISTLIEASFDCKKAVSPAEKTVCRDPALANLDRRLSNLYRQVLETSSDSEQVKASQRHWLRTIRNGCTTAPCMRTAYERRIAILGKMSKEGLINSKF